MNGQFQLGAVTPLRYFFGIAVVLGLIFATIGDGDEATPFMLNLLIWQLQTLVPMALFVGSHLLLSNSRNFLRLNPWLRLVLSGTFGALLFSPLNLMLDTVLQGEQVESLSLGIIDELTGMAPTAILSWLAINAPWVLGFKLERDSSSAPVSSAPSRNSEEIDWLDAPFMSLLPEELRAEPIYLKAELHYLTVATTAGNHLLLYNLKDAVSELPQDSGFQCHRSYWANKKFIDSVERQGRQGVMRLKDGSRLPISRNQLQQALALVA